MAVLRCPRMELLGQNVRTVVLIIPRTHSRWYAHFVELDILPRTKPTTWNTSTGLGHSDVAIFLDLGHWTHSTQCCAVPNKLGIKILPLSSIVRREWTPTYSVGTVTYQGEITKSGASKGVFIMGSHGQQNWKWDVNPPSCCVSQSDDTGDDVKNGSRPILLVDLFHSESRVATCWWMWIPSRNCQIIAY